MSKTIVTTPAADVAPATIEQARAAMVTAAVSDHGAAKTYAAFCLNAFGPAFWVKDSKGYAGWGKERDALKDALKAKGHTNPRQVVRRLLAAAMGTSGRSGNTTRELPERCEKDIGSIYTALKREEKTEGGLSAVERKWLAGIGKLLADMNVDLNALLPKVKAAK